MESTEHTVPHQHREYWPIEEKLALVRRTYEAGASVSRVARETGVPAGLLLQWRKLDREGRLLAGPSDEATPTSELAAVRAELAKLQRLLGKKTART